MSGAGAGSTPPGSGVGGFGMGALAESWAQAGKSATPAQEQAGRTMAGAMRATPGMGGDAPAFAALAFAASAPDTAELRRGLRAPKRQGRPALAASASPQKHGGAGQAKGSPPA